MGRRHPKICRTALWTEKDNERHEDSVLTPRFCLLWACGYYISRS